MQKMLQEAPFKSNYIEACGSNIHYIEQGEGSPILFLHGIPTSSYVWRNVIPCLSKLGRCIAPDLIGMGKSEKPNIQYSIMDHIRYIEKFIEALNLKNIILVMHGWGTVIGFNYAMNYESNCKGLAFYEAFLSLANESNFSLPLREQLYLFENNKNQNLNLEASYYIDNIFPKEMLCNLSKEALTSYREPFLVENSGKPWQQYFMELTKENKEYQQIVSSYSKKLTQSKLPKLMLYSLPGFITTIETAIWAKNNLPNLDIIEIGEELHYAQESNPTLMGDSIGIWLQSIENKG